MFKYLRKYKHNKGFTVIELIVVISIISVLVLLAVPRFIGQTEKAKMAQIQNDVRVVEGKLAELLVKKPETYEEWTTVEEEVLQDFIESEHLFGRGGPVLELKPGLYKEVSENFVDDINTQLDGDFFADKRGNIYYYEPNLNFDDEVRERPEGHEYDFENSQWEYTDFTYEENTVTGFSESGKKKNENGLTELVVPDRSLDDKPVTVIGDHAFPGLSVGRGEIPRELTSVVLPDTLVEIGYVGLYNNNIKEVYFPENLQIIGDDAFRYNDLSNLYLPDSVRTVGERAFWDNGLNDASVNITTELSEEAFTDNPDFNLEFRNREWVVEDFTFDGTTVTGFSRQGETKNTNGMTDLTVPTHNPNGDPVTVIGDHAFPGLSVGRGEIPRELTSVVLPDTLVEIGYVGLYNNNISEISLPNSLETIGNSALRYNNLSSVYIPDSVSNINDYAFSNNNLKEISSPKSINISKDAFKYNPNQIITYR